MNKLPKGEDFETRSVEKADQRTSEIYFHKEQLKYLERCFPVVTFGATATHAEMLHYNGQQRVLQYIRERTK